MKRAGNRLLIPAQNYFHFSKIEAHYIYPKSVTKMGTGNYTVVICPLIFVYASLLHYILLILNSPLKQLSL